ncbi:MAG TPA: heme-binding beta-barrel domain-containing protein [Acidimicrobiales bacterium]|jgi:hypothetical protein|nr:heme-binding beta-barrel domain-containing protein [Acidimicrobiales bacterium]
MYGSDIFTEPSPDPDTLANLGPLAPMAGVWEGQGLDTHPVASGSKSEPYAERYELQPIDPQTNGPQLFYGLRYHTHIVKPNEIETFHDQVGYWLWEPATTTVTYSLAIPRGQVVLAAGTAAPDAATFEVTATLGSSICGILSNPFLDQAFRTRSYRMRVTIGADGTWSYESESVLEVAGAPAPFAHVDRNTLTQVSPPMPNPLSAAQPAVSDGVRTA